MSHAATRRDRRKKPGKYLRRRIFAIALLVVLAIALLGFLNRGAVRTYFDELGGNDYVGSGHSSVSLVVHDGDSGVAVAHQMVKLDIVKNYAKVYRLILDRNQVFYPGTYQLHLQMSSVGALDLLADPASLKVNKVTIKEGLRVGQVFDTLSKSTGVPLADFESYLHEPSQIGVPSAEVSIEGWLFPATYSFAPNLSAKQILSQMVDRMKQELDGFGVAEADRHKVLTLASMIQKEARQPQDFFKVSRTFLNRININMPLQSDATVSYGSGGSTVTTTDAERADPNGYNTYVHAGLPIGPISAPGRAAIDAALHPANGSWLYFCAVNMATGETVFSSTIAEHEVAVAKFRAWMAANPGWNG